MPTFECRVFFSRLSAVAAEDAEVRVGVSLADAALVFLKRHVELPMQTVLDRPVAAHGGGESAGRHVLAQDVVPHFAAFVCRRARVSLIACRCAFRFCPACPVRQIVGRRTDEVGTRLSRGRVLCFRRHGG